MAITVSWFDPEKTILYWYFDGQWTWEDYALAQDESNAMMENMETTVDVIGDLVHAPSLPVNALTAYRGFAQRTNQHVDLIVLVGASTFVKGMVRMFTTVTRWKIPGTNFAFADTIEEARAIIEQGRTRR